MMIFGNITIMTSDFVMENRIINDAFFLMDRLEIENVVEDDTGLEIVFTN